MKKREAPRKAETLPIDIEAEKAVLGALLCDNSTIPKARSVLNPEDFFNANNREIYTAMLTLDSDGESVDVITLKSYLENTTKIDNMPGGYVLLGELVDIPTAVNIDYHVRAVKEKSILRKLSHVGDEIYKGALRTHADPGKIIQDLQEEIERIGRPRKPDWMFWREHAQKGEILIEFDSLKYLRFLSKDLCYRTFFKRGVPCIVQETPGGFEYCLQRNSQVITVKNVLLDLLKEEGFGYVASEMMLKTRLFSLDVLENLPEIPKEKIRASVFSQGETQIKLQGEYIGEEPIMFYRDPYSDFERPLLNRHDIGVIVAKQGSGKSKACELLISRAIFEDSEPLCPFGFHLSEDEIILHIDTEQSHDDNLRTLRRIAKRTHARINALLDEQEEFKNYRLEMCADDVDDIGFWLLEKIESIANPIGLLVIDTLLDTTDDMNSQPLANQFFKDLRQAARARNFAVLCTIHASPGSDDAEGKGMGHLGSLFMRKASTFLQVRTASDNKDVKILSSDFKNAKARHAKDYGLFSAFAWDNDNMAHFIDYEPEESPKKKSNARKIKAYMEAVLEEGALTKGMLIARYMKYAECSQKTAYNHYEQARASGLLVNQAGKLRINPDK